MTGSIKYRKGRWNVEISCKELKRAISVLEKADSHGCEKIKKILKEIVKTSIEENVNLIDRNQYFATILWQDDDIKTALEERDFSTLSENVERIKTNSKKQLEDCSHGWDVIDVVIDMEARYLK